MTGVVAAQARAYLPRMASELQIKTQRLVEFLERNALDGVLLNRRDNFSWITCGRDNHIANNTPGGVATILATRDGQRICLANAIEAPRFRNQELLGTGIETIDFPWYDGEASKKRVGEVLAGRKVATDGDGFGHPLPPLPGGFDELRWSLTPEEIERYRSGAKRAAEAMEVACREIKPGMTGHEIAGRLDYQIHRRELNPLVTLVATDEQVLKFRHPIPKPDPLRKYAMLVTCAQWSGLVSCLTRFVHVGPLPMDLQDKFAAVCNVDAAVNFATRPGRTLGQVFEDLTRAYAENGHPDQWKLHHQGGSTGYNPRDRIGTPGNDIPVYDNQAFAWNPSITGTKSEDTVLCTAGGVEVLTAHSSDWPTIVGRAGGKELRRAGVLVL
jgi:Xaa-Pro dipeptidase